MKEIGHDSSMPITSSFVFSRPSITLLLGLHQDDLSPGPWLQLRLRLVLLLTNRSSKHEEGWKTNTESRVDVGIRLGEDISAGRAEGEDGWKEGHRKKINGRE